MFITLALSAAPDRHIKSLTSGQLPSAYLRQLAKLFSLFQRNSDKSNWQFKANFVYLPSQEKPALLTAQAYLLSQQNLSGL
jgi:hypothetical protein